MSFRVAHYRMGNYQGDHSKVTSSVLFDDIAMFQEISQFSSWLDCKNLQSNIGNLFLRYMRQVTKSNLHYLLVSQIICII